MAVYVLYLTRDLGLSAGVIGLIIELGGIGALVGSTLAGPLARRIGQGPAMIWGQLLFGLTGLLIPMAVLIPRYALPLVAASEFSQWLALLLYVVNAVSVRQTVTPDRLLGRVNATMRFLRSGVLPVGSLLGGVLGGIIGVPWTLVVGEFGMLIAVALLLWSPLRQLRAAEFPVEEPEPPAPPVVIIDTTTVG
jgi:MFS family permease